MIVKMIMVIIIVMVDNYGNDNYCGNNVVMIIHVRMLMVVVMVVFHELALNMR